MIDIKWNKQYSVGHAAIDHQHRVFIDLIRSTSDAVDSRLNKEIIRRAFDELVLYAKFHFFSEETLMINSEYPGYESHRQLHVQLLTTLGEKIEEYMSNAETREAFIEFIFECLVLHILDIDRKFTEYLNPHLA